MGEESLSLADDESWLLTPGGARREGAWRRIPTALLAATRGPEALTAESAAQREGEGYQADEALITAANAAIRLGQPLLLTGEPGSGKSTFADHVAWQLGLDEAERFQIRSDMTARELFYRYDDLARFRRAQERQGGESFAPEEFLHLSALGRAIVRASKPQRGVGGDLRKRLMPDVGPKPVRSVVLIDEIDKAPRDVPNDLLGYLTPDRLWFDVPELGGRGERVEIEADPTHLPIVIFTSNSERALPDAFLRRCLFHKIDFPAPEDLRRIVAARALKYSTREYTPNCNLVRSVVSEVERVRDRCPAHAKKPGLAEVLAFFLALDWRGLGKDEDLGATSTPWRDLARMTLLKQDEVRDSIYPRAQAGAARP